MLKEAYQRLRPYLYHLTARSNLEAILESRALLPAKDLLEQARRDDVIRARRRGHLTIECDKRPILIRDQDPLHPGNVKLAVGWTFDDLIEELNRRVFFWAGTAAKPIAAGQRHFSRYASEGPVVLRVRFQELVAVNPHLEPEFCKYNSGAPRCNRGLKSPRGPQTFLKAEDADFSCAQVQEVTFAGSVTLPKSLELAQSHDGSWQIV